MWKEVEKIQTGLGLQYVYCSILPIYNDLMLLLIVKIQSAQYNQIHTIICNASHKCIEDSGNTIRRQDGMIEISTCKDKDNDGLLYMLYQVDGTLLLDIAMPPRTQHHKHQPIDNTDMSIWCNIMCILIGIAQMIQQTMGKEVMQNYSNCCNPIGLSSKDNWWGVGALNFNQLAWCAALSISNIHTFFTRVFHPTDGTVLNANDGLTNTRMNQSIIVAIAIVLMAFQCILPIIEHATTNPIHQMEINLQGIQ